MGTISPLKLDETNSKHSTLPSNPQEARSPALKVENQENQTFNLILAACGYAPKVGHLSAEANGNPSRNRGVTAYPISQAELPLVPFNRPFLVPEDRRMA